MPDADKPLSPSFQRRNPIFACNSVNKNLTWSCRMAGGPKHKRHQSWATAIAHGPVEVLEAFTCCSGGRRLGPSAPPLGFRYPCVLHHSPCHIVCEPKENDCHCSLCPGWPRQVQWETGVFPEREDGTTLPTLQPSPWVSSSPSCLPRLWKFVPQPRRMNCWQSAACYWTSQSDTRTASATSRTKSQLGPRNWTRGAQGRALSETCAPGGRQEGR